MKPVIGFTLLAISIGLLALTSGSFLIQSSTESNDLLQTDEIFPKTTPHIAIDTLDDDLNQASASLLIPFVENVGQENNDVKFYADTFAGKVSLTDDNLTYSLNADSGSYIIHESFVSGSLIDFQGLNQHTMDINYFIGNDPDKWYSNIPTYDGISLDKVWDGIDVLLYAHGNNVEKIFTVNPNFDVTTIQLTFDGISNLQLGIAGDLILLDDESSSIISMSAPIAFQNINGEKIDIQVEYKILNDTTYGFTVGVYDGNYPLVIDPLLESTWLGGAAKETNEFEDIDIDSEGNVFVVARYHSVNHSDGNSDVYIEGIAKGTTNGHGQSAISDRPGDGSWGDVVIFKLNNELSEILQATYLGDSSGEDSWPKLAIGNDDTVYVSGETNSTSFPGASSGFSTSGNLFVSQFSNDLTVLHESLVFGGAGYDENFELDIDSNGDLFLMGETNSTSLPNLRGGTNPQGTPNQDDETIKDNASFIVKIKGDLSTVIQSTFIGGTGYDHGQHMLVDPYDNPIIAGYSNSDDILGTGTAGFTPLQARNAGGNGGWHAGESYGTMDLFLTKFSNDLTSVNSTFIGGTGFEAWPNMAISPVDGTIYIGSETKGATDFPGIDNTSISDGESFIGDTKINDILNRVAYVDPTIEANDFISNGDIKTGNKLKTIAIGIIDYTNTGGVADPVTVRCVDENDFNNDSDCSSIVSTVEIVNCDDIADELSILDCNDGLNSYGYPGWVEKRVKLLKTGPGVFEFKEFQYTKYNTYAPLVNIAFKIDNNLEGGLKSTYFPYTSAQGFSSLAIDSQGSVYLAGQAGDRDLPNLTGGIHEEALGGTDNFVTKINAAFTEIIQTTLIGSSYYDENPEIVFDSNDNLFVLGSANNNAAVLSESVNDNGAQKTMGGGGGDFWVMKLSADLLSVEALAALLSNDDNNGGGGGCDDCTPPTFGKNKAGAQIVSEGFVFNNVAVDVIDYHTDFPLITVITNVTNSATVKVYENQGISSITMVQFGLGMPEVGSPLNDAQTLVEISLSGEDIDEVTVVDDNNLVDVISIATDTVLCSESSSTECLELTMQYVYRDQPKYNVMAINAIDLHRNSNTNYMNDGILVTGESINEPLTQKTSLSKANSFYPQKTGLVTLTLVDYKTDMWQDEYGYMWSTNGYGPYLVDKIPQPIKQPDTYSNWSGYNDRLHSEFNDYKNSQLKKTIEQMSQWYYKHESFTTKPEFAMQKTISLKSSVEDLDCSLLTAMDRDNCKFSDLIDYEITRAEKALDHINRLKDPSYYYEHKLISEKTIDEENINSKLAFFLKK